MKRQLPIFEIDGTRFIIDVQNNELRQENNPANSISFDDMHYGPAGYTMHYHKKEKNLPDIFKSDSDVVEITIPHMVRLDPEGAAQRFNVTVSELEGKNDLYFLVDQQLLQQRLNGVLPKIDIAGTTFIVDWSLKELRPEDGITPGINLQKLHMSDDGEHYICFYDKGAKQVTTIDHNLTALPENTVMLKIPYEVKLDPLAVAREYGIDEINFLKTHSLQKDLKAAVVPLSETGLPAMVERNKQKVKNKNSVYRRQPQRKNKRNKL